jgi:hypothetical protein
LAKLPKGDVDAVVASPPFRDARSHVSDKGCIAGNTPTAHDPEAMGTSDGNLNAMLAGDVDAVVASPPYADGCVREGSTPAHEADQIEGSTRGLVIRAGDGTVAAVVCSPPYASGDSASAQSISERTDKSAEWIKQNCGSAATKGYGRTEGQLGEMRMEGVEHVVMSDAVVRSPPYEGSLHAADAGIDWSKAATRPERWKSDTRPGASVEAAYPRNAENIGNVEGETFWDAAKQIVAECFAILRPGGTAVWVVKHFVRDKQLVDFPGDWRKLCEHVGFVTDKEVHAMLVAEERVPDLFDGERVRKRERKSFFRRLYERKYPGNEINFETVLFMHKP